MMIGSLTLFNIWKYSYDQVKYFTSFENDCHFFNNLIWNTTTIINRLIFCVLWILPIIFNFWPLNRRWYGTIIKNNNESSDKNAQIFDSVGSSSSLDENDVDLTTLLYSNQLIVNNNISNNIKKDSLQLTDT